MSESIKEKVIVGVVTAIILGVLTLLFNWASQGGLVRALGGVTEAEVNEKLEAIALKEGPQGPAGPQGEKGAPVPVGAVVAFDRGFGCPEGWTDFALARGRTIIGASSPTAATGGLTRRQFQAVGGAEQHTLKPEEMPAHHHKPHDPADIFVAYRNKNSRENTHFNTQKEGGTGSLEYPSETALTGGPNEASLGEASPHNNMPPFIALYFCKKESG